MPELPEVELVLNQLRTHILGGTIRKVRIARADIIRVGLASQAWYPSSRITNIVRRGKSLVFECTREEHVRYIVAELGMTGLCLFQSASAGYAKHIHITFSLDHSNESILHYWNPRRFGRVYLFDQDQLARFLKKRFGPDPLSLTQEEFGSLIGATRGRVKAFLLNQHKVAGIGNIYANEILYDARVHPHTQGHRLSKVSIARLYASTQTILTKAIRCGGSSIRDFRAPDGSKGRFQKQHVIYQKSGAPCPRGCPKPIKRLVAERSSFYCSTCQKRR